MIQALIGNTPLYLLSEFGRHFELKADIYAKLERNNPAGSIKDRAADYMIRDAVARGVLASGGTVIEPTSGNTGIALAALGSAMGFETIIVMPDSMSEERRKLIRAYGAQLVLTPGAQGMKGAIAKAQELVQQHPGSFMPMQFENPANARAHYETTGPELWQQSGGSLDALVAGVGTGGTITGAGRYLKEQNPQLSVIAVEPASSAVLSGGAPGAHALQGIGAGFVPELLDTSVYDRVFPVENEEALAMTQTLVKLEGLLVGTSSAAALCAALRLAQEEQMQGKKIAVIFPDGGEKYLSSQP